MDFTTYLFFLLLLYVAHEICLIAAGSYEQREDNEEDVNDNLQGKEDSDYDNKSD